jgi:translocation and assembly module TamB
VERPAGRRRPEQPDTARNIQLLAPAPITLAASAWQVGPLRLAGNPLDWQATVRPGRRPATERHAGGAGSRIGQVDGQLAAAMQGAWSLARDTPGKAVQAAISDLGWLAEFLGEGWQSAGRLNGELQLAGTPNRPCTAAACAARSWPCACRPKA